MASRVTITDRTAQALQDIGRMTSDGVIDFTQTSTDITKSTAPVRTVLGGNHRSSIGWKRSGNKQTILFSASNYGAYLEFGTSKMAARPHFLPGIKQAMNEFKRGGKWGK